MFSKEKNTWGVKGTGKKEKRLIEDVTRHKIEEKAAGPQIPVWKTRGVCGEMTKNHTEGEPSAAPVFHSTRRILGLGILEILEQDTHMHMHAHMHSLTDL